MSCEDQETLPQRASHKINAGGEMASWFYVFRKGARAGEREGSILSSEDTPARGFKPS